MHVKLPMPTLGFITLLLVGLFVTLGGWQLHRGEYKKALLAQYHNTAEVQNLSWAEITSTPAPLDQLRYQGIRLKGSFKNTPVILLDNQVYQHTAGYLVLSLFEVESTTKKPQHILINRGWIPLPKTRAMAPRIPPVPPGILTLEGKLNLPSKPWSLTWGNPSAEIETSLIQTDADATSPTPIRIQRLVFDELSNYLGVDLFPLLIDLPLGHPNSFQVIPLVPASLSPEKHLGYALQWFTMGLIGCLYYVLTKRPRDT